MHAAETGKPGITQIVGRPGLAGNGESCRQEVLQRACCPGGRHGLQGVGQTEYCGWIDRLLYGQRVALQSVVRLIGDGKNGPQGRLIATGRKSLVHL